MKNEKNESKAACQHQGEVLSDRRITGTVGTVCLLRLSVCIYVHAPLTTCMAELRGGCGSMSNWQGVCPKLLI